MVKYFKNKKGTFYILVAILCIANLIVGFEVIRKLTHKEVALSTAKVSNIRNISKKTNKSKMYLELIASSNSYMDATLSSKYKEKNVDRELKKIIYKPLKIFSPKQYLKSQLPAILTLADNRDINVTLNLDDSEDHEGIEYEDIIFEDDIPRNYEGKEVEFEKDLISGEKPETIKINDDNPYILIYHTHATESYKPATKGNYHTTERLYNVLTIGEIIGKELKDKGHKVKHIDKYHDLPDYNKSYRNSLETVQNELNASKNLKVIFDIHRDGFDETSPTVQQLIDKSKISVNGKNVATFSLIIGANNPNKEQLLKFARYIRDEANKMYPGICKGITLKPGVKFNQYLSDYHSLIEIGSNLNTIDEAKESAYLISNIMDKVIKDLKEEK